MPLEILLDSFAGPLDFLLYLIKKQNLDILDINVAKITEQPSYIELMDAMQVELAGDYLVMAAYLAELKSRMLLPRPEEQAEEEDQWQSSLNDFKNTKDTKKLLLKELTNAKTRQGNLRSQCKNCLNSLQILL